MRKRKICKASAWLMLGFIFLFMAGCQRASQTGEQQIQARAGLIKNGSFEELKENIPEGWRTRTWSGKASFQLENFGRSGNSCIMISSDEGADASWITTAKIEPYSRYRLSGWIKTEGLEPGQSLGALINVHGFREWRTRSISGTEDWTKVEVEFDAGANDALDITCLFGGWGRARGKAWFDDIELAWLSGKKLGQPYVRIDPTKTGKPVSKYIYGQFIEHLGRCIYQGLWAEMVEDRKFFWPVGQGESPWQAIGPAQNVRMDRKNPFSGEHSPVVSLSGKEPGGIRQEGLAFVAGKEYEGRVVLSGNLQAGSALEINFIWGEGPEGRYQYTLTHLASKFEAFPFRFVAGDSNENGRVEIVSSGPGSFKIGALSLMPADNVEGFRPDVIALLRELDSPVYRWPGGNFVSGYDWRDGIGDRDRRPTRKNPAWLGIEPNDVGIHEFLKLMEIIGSEPLIVVNSGLGDAKMAAAEVEYVNGGPETPMGKLRAANGHPEPWQVKFWGIGNEMYGDWQLGHMPLADYVKKHIEFAQVMRRVDPAIQLVAVGAVGVWSETMLTQAAEYMDLISEHFYVGSRPGLLSHVNQVPLQIRRIAEAHRRYREQIDVLKTKEIPVALDEWNYWYGPYIYGELGTQYFLKDALGVAAGLNEFARHTDVYFMANYAQTVNVIGAIKTSKTAAVFDTTGYTLKMYRQRFGTIPVHVSGEPEPLDIMASLKENGNILTIAVVNPTEKEFKLKIDLEKAKFALDRANLYLITGKTPDDANVPGKPLAVFIQEKTSIPFGRKIVVPPLSASIYEVSIVRMN